MVGSLLAADAASAAARRVQAFPLSTYFRAPIADLHRPGFGVVLKESRYTGIVDAGSTRYDLRVGGAFGLVRWSGEHAGRGIQLDLIAGIDGQFDVDHGYDNIGWDGNYGLQATAPWGERTAVRLAVLHTSSHIGDELIERTGRRRIGYTREELAAGARRDLGAGLSIYGEAGYGYELRNRDLQEPWRLQAGLDFDPAPRRPDRSWAWFAAVDASATEERDYRLDLALKAGRSFRAGERRWRLGVELYDGRPGLGEFFADTEAHVALGVWLDL